MYQERTGTSADGADLVATYTGATFTLNRYMTSIVEGWVEVEPHAGTFGVDLRVDGQSFGSQNVDISGATSVFGTAVFGTATFGGAGRKLVPLTLPLEAEGITFSLSGTYTGREAFRWFTYAFGVVPEISIRGL